MTLKNLTRNKVRSSLTILAIALPLTVFLVTATLRAQIDDLFAEMDRSMRVATHQKLTYTTSLPQRLRGEIESIAPDGYVTAVCRTSWYGGRIEGRQLAFPSMAVDSDNFHVVYDEYEMTPDEVDAFQSEKRAAVVGSQFAKMADVKIGDRITLKGGIPPFAELEFIVTVIPSGRSDPWFYFRLDYYDEVVREMTGNPIGIHNYWLKCSGPKARQWALEQIDRHFENTQYETRTELESTFVRSFIESGGDWVEMGWRVGCMIVLVALFVALNTLSMSFRERAAEFAVLRALGFSSWRVSRIMLLEGILLGAIGGILATGPLLTISYAGLLEIPTMGPLTISPATAGMVMLVAVGCGAAAAAGPSLMAGKLEVAPALRKAV